MVTNKNSLDRVFGPNQLKGVFTSQLRDLAEAAKQKGYDIVKELEDILKQGKYSNSLEGDCAQKIIVAMREKGMPMRRIDLFRAIQKMGFEGDISVIDSVRKRQKVVRRISHGLLELIDNGENDD